MGFDPWVGGIPWRREWQPTPVFLPGEFHGQRRLVGYSPWCHQESDRTKALKCTHTSTMSLLIQLYNMKFISHVLVHFVCYKEI